ncbi:MAG: phosphotransferase [Candidatus Altimarinota bacterium]
MEKGVCGKEKLPILPKLPSLYDDPDYDFLANYKDILGENLTQANIMGEGVNGIVFRHSVDDVVVKVRKPGIHIDDLGIEIQNHGRALVLLENFNGINKGANIYIPEILKEDPRGFLKGYFTMEKINGQTLTTKMFRDLHPGLKNELPGFLDSLSDKDIINLLLNKYSETPANLKKLFDDNSSSYVAQIKKDNPYLSKFLDYLKENKLDHTDLHSGNIMIDKDGRIYIIDFGRVN